MPGVIKRQGTITSKALVLDPAGRIRVLSDHGSSVDVDKAIPIKRYFRSGSEMERQARVYYTEGQWDRAFILYNKFATLFIEKLPKHPEYSKALPTDKTRIKKLLKHALPRAMELKEKLKEKFEKEKEELENTIQEEEEEQSRKKEEDMLKKQMENEVASNQASQIAAFFSGQGGVVTSPLEDESGVSHMTNDDQSNITEPSSLPLSSSPPPPPDYSEDKDVIADAPQSSDEPVQAGFYESTPREDQMEISPADQSGYTATDPTLAHVIPSPSPSPSPSPYSDDASPYPAPSAPPPQFSPQSYNPAFMGGGAAAVATLAQPHVPVVQTPPINQPRATYSHPALQQPTYEGSLFQSPYQPHPTATPTPPGANPSPVPYSYQSGAGSPYMASPTTPLSYDVGVIGEEEMVAEYTGPPTVDRSTKPGSIKGLNSGWGAEGYRPVYIPMDTATRFEEVASTNTRRNVETCGILAGKLSQNTLLITHIIVPKQKGQADSCETLNEEELFDVQDQYDLITLGWIHTHPSQTSFMSSVDLHCHCSYQIMMDEAVAIVVAPKYNQVGYFMLTEPHGLNYITHCEEEGFHVHPKEPPLYEDCKHIHHDSKSFIQIVDLR